MDNATGRDGRSTATDPESVAAALDRAAALRRMFPHRGGTGSPATAPRAYGEAAYGEAAKTVGAPPRRPARGRRPLLVTAAAGALGLLIGAAAVHSRDAGAEQSRAGAGPQPGWASGPGDTMGAPATSGPDSAAAAAPPATRPTATRRSSPAATATATSTPRAAATGRANPGRVNLALKRPAAASSQEGDHYGAGYAVDGDPGTRWGSAFADPQWLRVDLGRLWAVDEIEVVWEHAYATSYRIDVSPDGRRWRTVHRTDAGTGGTVIVDTRTPARYVRVSGSRRNSRYGYSIFELVVR